MLTISTIATPDPHPLLTIAHHRPCRVFLAGGRVPHSLAEAPAQLDGTHALLALAGADLFGPVQMTGVTIPTLETDHLIA